VTLCKPGTGRLRRIEQVLGVSLDTAESRTSLHVAMLAQAALGKAAQARGQ